MNLHHDKNRRRGPVRDGKIFRDHRQDGNVAVGGIGNLARWGPWAENKKITPEGFPSKQP